MIASNVRIAMQSIRSTRVRSLLTTLGVVIGVAAVVVSVNIGQGVKKQVNGQIDAAGGTLITVRSGRVVSRDSQGQIVDYNLNQALGSSTLTPQDLQAIQQLDSIALATPLAEVSAVAKTLSGDELLGGHIIGTNASAPTLLGKEIVFGSMFNDTDRQYTAVVGADVAHQWLGDPAPIGRVIRINGTDFIIKGVFDRFLASPVNLGTDLNRAVFIPYTSFEAINAGNAPIREILVRANQPDKVDAAIGSLHSTLASLHGQEDFSVLRQSDLEFITDDIFGLITALIAAVAGISLAVGGIGIMNIMLVSVAERTREIGIRKAIGASNLHIMMQFLTESVVLSLIGGFVGVLIALVASASLRVLTDIRPVFNTSAVLITLAASTLVGIIFGVGPAWKAARKKPIEGLRS